MLTMPKRVTAAAPERTLPCPACGTDRGHREVYRKQGYPILACRGCGLGRTFAPGFDPRGHYTTEFFTGGHHDGYGDYPNSGPVLQAEFRSVVKAMAKAGCRGGRLLELGSAYGYFLEVARDAGFQTTGLEICADAAAAAKNRGLDSHAGVLTPEFLNRREPFDAVVMLDVIEHLADPDDVLSLLNRTMNPGGHLVLTTGDWHALYARLSGPRWRLMIPPQHLFYYTKKTLRMLLDRHGFDVHSMVYPWKTVPLGLMAYQVSRRNGLRIPLPKFLHSLGLPVNLFDAVRVIARKRAA